MITQHRKKFNIYVFNPENKIIESLINHVYNWSIADLLVKILNQDIMKSDFKNEVIQFIITEEDLKD